MEFVPELIPAFVLLWIFRRLWEKEFAEQVVTVTPGKIIWAIRTRWWTRRREITGVRSISASAGWGGFGRVILKTQGREYALVQWVL
ncbi:MAG TPA: hypothetical protein VHC72_02015 [Bryobacteraceae bacterium]|nr:hypothetical protein [Bryobacteraceae bacterium]